MKAIDVLREYVRKTTPAAKHGEISFWSCSCLPYRSMTNSSLYAPVNIYWQEVFSIYETGNQLAFSWHVVRKPLRAVFKPGLIPLRRK